MQFSLQPLRRTLQPLQLIFRSCSFLSRNGTLATDFHRQCEKAWMDCTGIGGAEGGQPWNLFRVIFPRSFFPPAATFEYISTSFVFVLISDLDKFYCFQVLHLLFYVQRNFLRRVARGFCTLCMLISSLTRALSFRLCSMPLYSCHSN